MPAAGATVRPARDDELDAAGAVVAAAYDADGLASDAYLAKLRDARSRAAAATVLVAVEPAGATGDGGRVLGSATYAGSDSPLAELSHGLPGVAELRAIGVLPAARGRGLAAAMVTACLDLARREGRTRVLLSTQPQMLAAQRLYARLGFTRRPDLDWVPEPDVSLLGYELPL